MDDTPDVLALPGDLFVMLGCRDDSADSQAPDARGGIGLPPA